MPDTTNSYRSIDVADRLNELMAEQNSTQAGNTAQQQITPQAIVGAASDVDVHDSMDETMRGNYQVASSTIDVSGAITDPPKSAATGTWQIPFDKANSTNVASPIEAVAFFDIATI